MRDDRRADRSHRPADSGDFQGGGLVIDYERHREVRRVAFEFTDLGMLLSLEGPLSPPSEA